MINSNVAETDYRFADIFNENTNKKILQTKKNIDEVLIQAKGVLIFGAGHNGKRIAPMLMSRGHLLLGFIDEMPENKGKMLDNLPVFSLPEAAQRYGNDIVIIVSIFQPNHSFQQSKQKLEKLGWRVLSILHFAFLYPDDFLPFYFLGQSHTITDNKAAYDQLYHSLIDDRSKQELVAHLNFRLLIDFSVLPYPIGCDFSYVKNRFTRDTTFIDGGAYNGDTVQAFLNMVHHRFQSIVAYEPDENNFAKLSAYHEALPTEIKEKVCIVNKGIWSQSGRLGFSATATPGSSLSYESDNTIEVVALDDIAIFENVFIKLDVEGAEIAALHGAKQVIQNGRTIFCIAVYHQTHDLWQIPELIHKYNKHYEFGLRSHGHDGADLMLYAFPVQTL